MFRHHGDNRTYKQNLQIASLLSFVAGAVNVVGFIALNVFTTNVTGHFANFVDEIFNLRFYQCIIFFLYIQFFLLGAFVSNTLVEIIDRRNAKNIFILPVALEISILVTVAILGIYLWQTHPNIIACLLLFSMGLQNALVTKISNAIVRTTHLTGLFTDLGIELSQLLFYKEKEQREKLRSNISLRISIITFFFLGGVSGGLLYTKMQFYSLLIPAAMLLIGLMYDNLKFRILKWKKKHSAQHEQ